MLKVSMSHKNGFSIAPRGRVEEEEEQKILCHAAVPET